MVHLLVGNELEVDWKSLLVVAQIPVRVQHQVLVASHRDVVDVAGATIVYLHLFGLEMTGMSCGNDDRIGDDIHWYKVKSIVSSSVDEIY